MDTMLDKVRLYCSCDIQGQAIPGQLPLPASPLINQITGSPLQVVGAPSALVDGGNKWHGSASLAAEFAVNTRLAESDASLAALTPTNPKLTVEYWVYRKHASAQVLIGKSGQGNVSYPNWMLLVQTNGAVSIGLGISGYMYGTSLGSGATPAGAVPVGVWTHVALVMDGPLAKIYINGVLGVTYTAPQHPNDGYPFPFYVGTDKDSGNFSTGCLIDDLRITAAVRYTGPFTPDDYSVDYPPLPALGVGMDAKVKPITVIPVNQEARAQFQPQDVAVRGQPAFYAGPVATQPIVPRLLCAGYSMQWIRDGIQNALQGYIESTVTISGIGVRRRVLCFDQAGNLEGETYSRASDGKYRFDRLWLNRRYMLVAQDDPAFGPADYNAVAADYQLPTPYAPGEGVGLTGG
ncbi:hypothetical protein D3C79_450840 [compost metagenome]